MPATKTTIVVGNNVLSRIEREALTSHIALAIKIGEENSLPGLVKDLEGLLFEDIAAINKKQHSFWSGDEVLNARVKLMSNLGRLPANSTFSPAIQRCLTEALEILPKTQTVTGYITTGHIREDNK